MVPSLSDVLSRLEAQNAMTDIALPRRQRKDDALHFWQTY
jgi:hypothetical protein